MSITAPKCRRVRPFLFPLAGDEDVARCTEPTHAGQGGALPRRLGPIERTDYGDAGLAKWDTLGRQLFEHDGTVVWALG